MHGATSRFLILSLSKDEALVAGGAVIRRTLRRSGRELRWIVLFGLIAAAHAGPAAGAEIEPTACATQATTVEMIECAGWHFEQADLWLAQVLQFAHADTDREARRLLHATQRNWNRYRDAKCRADRDAARGGTLAPILEISCRTELTRAHDGGPGAGARDRRAVLRSREHGGAGRVWLR